MNEVYIVKLLLLISYLSSNVICNDILGCGGFVQSHVAIDYTKVEVKILTKQGIIKDTTQCAPNGYYFVPLYDKGEYILQLKPPTGWSFSPLEVPITVDGVSDDCTLNKDINFVFQGFGITGKVESSGTDSGPAGVNVELKAPNEVRTTVTSEGGSFFFTPVYPGTYTVTVSHPRWKIVKQSVNVVVVEGNTELPPKSFVVQGYDVTGLVKSDGQPVKNTKVVIFSNSNDNVIAIDGCNKSPLPGKFSKKPLCYVESDEKGKFVFPSVPLGKYYLSLYYEKQNIHFLPKNIEFEVQSDSVQLAESFEVTGFSMVGRIVKSEKGQPINGAKIFINGKEKAKTDKDGLYTLEEIKTGTYKITIEADNYKFEEKTVKVVPNMHNLDDILPSSYKVCGNVANKLKKEVVAFLNSDTNEEVTVETNLDNGDFCLYLSRGKYTVRVVISESDKTKGLQYFPVTKTFEVTGDEVAPIHFSQLKAVVSGEVKCIREADCNNFKVIFKSENTDDSLEPFQISTSIKGGKYSIENVTPGLYEVTLQSNKFCWNADTLKVPVNSAQVKVPKITQTGFAVNFISSHDTEVYSKLTGSSGAGSKIKITKGRFSHCLDKPGDYIFDLTKSCHDYESSTVSYTTDAGSNEVFLNAVRHKVQLAIKTDKNYEDLVVKVQSPVFEGEIPTSYENNHYKINLLLGPDEEAIITPQSSILYFTPQTSTILGTNDCEDMGVKFEAKKGLLLQGKVEPALAGVTITVESDSDLKYTTETNEKGFYKFPPLIDSLKYTVVASKESYIFVGPDQYGNFNAHKLAQVVVEVVDENGEALQGTLLSLSGGQSYRSNLQTGENGKITFHSLSPSDYFLRPMMKEYSFEPNSKTITVKEGQTQNIKLTGKRVAYSAYGLVTSLNGETEENVVVVAAGTGNCTHFSEESTSESNGIFRIRGLQPYCNYDVKIKSVNDLDQLHFERLAPQIIQTGKVTDDIRDLRTIIMRPHTTTDLLIRVQTSKPDNYKGIRVKIIRESSSAVVHTSNVDHSLKLTKDLNAGILIQVPPIPMDNNKYSVHLETNLPTKDSLIEYFTADSSFEYVSFNFEPQTNVIEQHIKQTSVWALVLIFFIIVIIYNIEVVFKITQDQFKFIFSNITVLNSKPTTNVEYTLDNAGIDEIVESINAVKKKNKPRRI